MAQWLTDWIVPVSPKIAGVFEGGGASPPRFPGQISLEATKSRYSFFAFRMFRYFRCVEFLCCLRLCVVLYCLFSLLPVKSLAVLTAVEMASACVLISVECAIYFALSLFVTETVHATK